MKGLAWGLLFSIPLWALIIGVVLVVSAHCQEPLLDSTALYHGSQAFVVAAGTWDAVDTGRGVRLYGEGGLSGRIVGRYNAGGNVALLLGVDGATLFLSHELANHGKRRWGTALNLLKGGFSAYGGSTWVGVPLGTHTRVGTPVPQRLR